VAFLDNHKTPEKIEDIDYIGESHLNNSVEPSEGEGGERQGRHRMDMECAVSTWGPCLSGVASALPDDSSPRN
jgi:hypothetical protein